MTSRCPIRYKLLSGVAMLCLIVVILSLSGIRSISSYRLLVRSLSDRAAELPLADELLNNVTELRLTLSKIRATDEIGDSTEVHRLGPNTLRLSCLGVHSALRRYQKQLDRYKPNGSGFGDRRDEREMASEIQSTLGRIHLTLDRIDQHMDNSEDWILDPTQADMLSSELEQLHQLARELPNGLQNRMQQLKGNVRGQYHALIALTWTTSVLSLVILFVLVKLFYNWVFRPLRILIRGSRRVARGDFDHRIQLDTRDEMAELAGAMNDMTSRFQQVRDDLDRQVKERTKEVVRSEQLASVGFLAAGVAHEINNPLASIAWSAESLESRMHDVLYGEDPDDDDQSDAELTVLRKYLRRIQEEAFRCKEITERLLDFSRLGDADKHDTDLGPLLADVIDMVRHLGRYRTKRIEFDCDQSVVARVNRPEFKQVVLNLVTNSLDSLEADGLVRLQLRAVDGQAHLVVRDNGCGMSDEVLEHLFEPFFTRRRDGQGTGLGLSITFRIVVDHGGRIEASSPGPGEGSTFRVTLPLVEHEKTHEKQFQAA